MTRMRLSVFALSALLSVGGAVLGRSEDGTLKEIAGYRQWTRISENPITVENPLFADAGD